MTMNQYDGSPVVEGEVNKVSSTFHMFVNAVIDMTMMVAQW